jgi:hypothetical protein
MTTDKVVSLIENMSKKGWKYDQFSSFDWNALQQVAFK